MRDTIDMAREAGLLTWLNPPADVIERLNAFAALVRADERKKQPATVQPVAQAWDEGYRAGIDDERTSEASIGIAGFDAKVEPARNNPYRTTPPAQPAPRQWFGLTDDEREAIFKIHNTSLGGWDYSGNGGMYYSHF